MSNESSSVWVVASRKVDAVSKYDVGEFVPIKKGLDDCRVLFKSGFLGRFGDGVESTAGVQSAEINNAAEWFEFSSLSDLSFQLAADIQQFQSSFNSEVELGLGSQSDRVSYEISWDANKNSKVIVELNAAQLLDVSFEGSRQGNYRRLNAAEKQRLGLSANRQFWIFETSSGDSQAGVVRFSLTKISNNLAVDVQLPQPLGKKKQFGLLRIRQSPDQDFEVESQLVELTVSNLQRDRVFQFSDQQQVRVQPKDRAGNGNQIQYQVSSSEVTLVNHNSLVQKIYLVVRKPVNVSPVNHQPILTVSSENASINNVHYRESLRRYAGEKVDESSAGGSWRVVVPAGDSDVVHAILEIALVRENQWNLYPLELPDVMINGISVDQQSKVTADSHWLLVDLNRFASAGIEENLRSLAWLPSLGFDSATSERFMGKQHLNVEFELTSGKTESLVFLLPRRLVVMLAIVILGLFIALAMCFQRNRHVLFVCLLFLFLVFVFGGMYGLLAALAFWGFAIGLIMRELNRLCKFSPSKKLQPASQNGTTSRVGLMLLLICLPLGSVNAQVDSAPKSGAKNDKSKKSVSAYIPVDEKDKPIGIAYLPAGFYEQLSKQKRSQASLICKNQAFEIQSKTDSRNLAAAIRLDLFIDEPKKLTLPLSIDGAIFDAQAVTIDSNPVSFRPINGNQAMEIVVEKAGEQTIEIEFQVPLKNNTAVNLKLPFDGAVEMVNRSGVLYSIQPTRNSRKSDDSKKLMRPNDSVLVEGAKSLALMPGNQMVGELTVVETIDLSQTPIGRELVVLSDEPITRSLRFSLGKQSKLESAPDRIRRVNGQFDVVGQDRRELRYSFSENFQLSPGPLRISPFDSTTHRVEKHLLLLRNGGNQKTIANVNPLGINELARRWGVLDSLLDTDDFDRAFEIRNGQRFQLWIGSPDEELNCIANHHYYLSRDSVNLRSEFELNSESAISVLEIQVPPAIQNVRFRLGEKILNSVAKVDGSYAVLANLDQPGRYLIELTGELAIESNKIKFFSPHLNAVSYESFSHFWTSRNRSISTDLLMPAEVMTSTPGFVPAGMLPGGSHELVSTSNHTFSELNIKEDVVFAPGKTEHRLSINLAKYNVGQWIGIELPRESELTESQQTEIEETLLGVVEKSNSLFGPQIWIPLISEQRRSFEVDFVQTIEGSRIGFARPLNCQKIQRQVSLPEKINGNEVQWRIEDGVIVRSVNDRIIWEVDREKPVAQYQLRDSGGDPMTVKFAEVAMDDSMQKMTCRFFLIPGDQDQVEIALPPGKLVGSVQVCGVTRNSQTIDNNNLQIQLLNSRFLQVIDVVLYSSGSTYSGYRQWSVPTVQRVEKYPVYFQCRSEWTVVRLQKVEFDSLLHARVDFVEDAINNFELNLENGEGWNGVLKSWVDAVIPSENLSAELQSRLDNLPFGTTPQDLTYANTAANVCRPGRTVHLLPSNEVQVVPPRKEQRREMQFQILAAIAAIGFLAMLTVRLPHWFRAPIFSFLMISMIWVFGVTWISLTPESIFAWCWLLFASLFVGLVIIDAVLKLRVYRDNRNRSDANGSAEGSVVSTQMDRGQTTN